MKREVVIIGYGTASVNAIIALRSAGYSGTITVLSNTATLPYSPVLTSYYAAEHLPRKRCFPWTEEELGSLNIEVLSSCPATSIDVDAHTIQTPRESIEYSKCIIATGASPTLNGFPRVHGYEPLVLRTMEDAEFLKEALGTPMRKHVLVSGTSMVALKTVEACLRRKSPVTLLGRSAHILKKSAFEEVAQRYEGRLQELGVTLLLGQTAQTASLTERGIEVTFSSGNKNVFSELVIAHGVAPNLSFVPEQALEREVGLIVDTHMRTSNPDVYAAGDVAQTIDLCTGERRIAGLWKDACLQGATAGRVIAAELAGRPIPKSAAYLGCIPNNCIEVLDCILISGGHVDGRESLRIETHEEDGCFSMCAFDGDRLVGFNVFSKRASRSIQVFDVGGLLMQRLVRGVHS